MFLKYRALVRTIARPFARFGGDEKAVAAVEFALILPLLVTLYIGMVEVTQAITVNRKVTHLASSLADLVTQTRSVSSGEMNDMFTATEAIMNPYDVTPLKVVLAAVDFDADGKAKVDWSVGYKRSAYAENQPPPVEIPEALAIPNTQIVIGQVEYSHSTTFSVIMKDLLGKTTFDYDEIFMLKPRLSDKVDYTG